MSATTIIETRPATRRVATYRNTIFVVLVAIIELTAMSQAHHHYAPKDAGGWRELPYYAVTGVLAYGVICLGLLRVRRSGNPARMSLVFGVLSALLLPLYFTVLPLSFAGTSLLLARDAQSGRLARASRVLAVLSALVIVAFLVMRLFGGTWNLGG
ncbi:MAG: hypothetical protein ABI775_04115 [Pseudonocardiales bacterium]|nr:hypothetical protein [Actinomycetota bacterium]